MLFDGRSHKLLVLLVARPAARDAAGPEFPIEGPTLISRKIDWCTPVYLEIASAKRHHEVEATTQAIGVGLPQDPRGDSTRIPTRCGIRLRSPEDGRLCHELKELQKNGTRAVLLSAGPVR